MEIMKELVKFADECDKQGYAEAASKLDEFIAKVAAEKKKKDEEHGEPLLTMNVKKSTEDDGSYDVTVYAPSGLEPNSSQVHDYVHKYGPFGFEEGRGLLDFQESKANSDPKQPNMFKYRLQGPANKNKGGGPAVAGPAAAAAYTAMPILAADTVETLAKIANELDSAGASDLADEIDSILAVDHE